MADTAEKWLREDDRLLDCTRYNIARERLRALVGGRAVVPTKRAKRRESGNNWESNRIVVQHE